MCWSQPFSRVNHPSLLKLIISNSSNNASGSSWSVQSVQYFSNTPNCICQIGPTVFPQSRSKSRRGQPLISSSNNASGSSWSVQRPPQISRLGRGLLQKAMTWMASSRWSRWSGFEICWRSKVTNREGNNHGSSSNALDLFQARNEFNLKRRRMWKRKVGQDNSVGGQLVSYCEGRWTVLLGLILPTHAFIQPPILPKLYRWTRKRKPVDPNLEDFTAGNIVIVATWGGLKGDATINCLWTRRRYCLPHEDVWCRDDVIH